MDFKAAEHLVIEGEGGKWNEARCDAIREIARNCVAVPVFTKNRFIQLVMTILYVIHANVALQIVDSNGIVGEAANNRFHIVYVWLNLNEFQKYYIEVIASSMVTTVFSEPISVRVGEKGITQNCFGLLVSTIGQSPQYEHACITSVRRVDDNIVHISVAILHADATIQNGNLFGFRTRRMGV